MTIGDQQWDVITDCVIVGSGGGSMCAALAVADAGCQALVVEKAAVVGGSTAMSGGVLWLPDNPVSRRVGVEDCREDARRYFASVVGDEGPATSSQRRESFLDGIEPMIAFLKRKGIPFRHCEGYPDYYDERPGGKQRGRSIETDLFDTGLLGPWESKLRVPERIPPIPMFTGEVAAATLGGRTVGSVRTIANVAGRALRALATKRTMRGSGAALQGWMLLAALRHDIPVWTNTPMVDLIVDDGAVLGVLVERDGRRLRIRARAGVLLNSGGFSHNAAMRSQYGKQPASTKWTAANPGDTGEVLEAAIRHGAATDLMDEAWWMPVTLPPPADDPLFLMYERSKPHGVLVDGTGQRYVNEACSYMEVGRAMFERHRSGQAVPSWWIMDSRHRRRYMWGFNPIRGHTPRKWLASGYMLAADNIAGLATRCGLPAEALEHTLERFNASATTGKDPDFGKGERAYDRYYGDPRTKPNPCVGPVDKPPFYAVRVYPGDVGTCGGMLTDEHARVLRRDGDPIVGLYATGNCTAPVVGRSYPGAGASIGVSFVFGWLAAEHMLAARTSALSGQDAVNVDTAR
ncbi:FAD-binding protein [Mycobacterium sp. E3247]|uniref:FAD-binding protein n=1 Tax=Mycobacterium sp. E3247 TaxID=1856864 RepID=UPI0007FD2242|nr:FAD-binding protein [Mycobacterium sp. E3247]OBH11764.1 3-oxosteroid 1-dehydrogenase [Mycobacterium sp. E3247]